MTVSNVILQPIPNLKNWYKLVFISRKDGIGETTTEMLCSEETLRHLRIEIEKMTPPVLRDSDLPENLRRFLNEDK